MKAKPVFDPRKEMVKKIAELASKHGTHQVFSDVMEMTALAISNKFDLLNFDKREARYMEAIKRYLMKDPPVQTYPNGQTRFVHEDLDKIVEISSCMQMAIMHDGGDLLGGVFGELGLLNGWHGQFFTPPELTRFMARITIGHDMVAAAIKERGYFTVMEPACGSGGMIISAAEVVRDLGYDPAKVMHASLIDIDSRCVHMAYVQCSLLDIPAIIYHGDALRMEIDEAAWFTPAHIVGGWSRRLYEPTVRKQVITAWTESRKAFNEAKQKDMPSALIGHNGAPERIRAKRETIAPATA